MCRLVALNQIRTEVNRMKKIKVKKNGNYIGSLLG
jgi:hypothetical protein